MSVTLSSKAQAAIEHIVARFQAGDLSPVQAVARLQLPADHPAQNWSFGNKVLAWAQANTLDCRGFQAWKEVGRSVKRGGHGIFIFKPVTVKRVDAASGEEELRLIGFSPIAVFPADQTEGAPTGLAACQPKQLPPLADLARRLGITVRYQPTPGDRLGDCNTTGTRINLGTHDARTFYHELGHAIHARLAGGLKGGQHADQETAAEFVACVLSELYGTDDKTGDAWRYIASYNADPLKAIAQAMKTVEQVVSFIEQSAETAAPVLHDRAEPYLLTWWSDQGTGDDAAFHQVEFAELEEAELAFACVRSDLSNDYIGRNWSSGIPQEADAADIPF